MGENELVAQTTAIIKAFERPEALRRLVRSLRSFYPEMPILVLDDSFTPSPPLPGVTRIDSTPDIGASAGRNRLLSRVTTPLFWQLDDDFELTKQTRFELLAKPVSEGRADIVAGDAVRCKRKWFGSFACLTLLDCAVQRVLHQRALATAGESGEPESESFVVHCSIRSLVSEDPFESELSGLSGSCPRGKEPRSISRA